MGPLSLDIPIAPHVKLAYRSASVMRAMRIGLFMSKDLKVYLQPGWSPEMDCFIGELIARTGENV